MLDNPRPDLAAVRRIVNQVARGLQAFHRLEMVHQDLKPDNIAIDGNGTVKILDFGATRVAGIAEIATPITQINLLGAEQYAAPEYFLGENGTSRSDIFPLASSPTRCCPAASSPMAQRCRARARVRRRRNCGTTRCLVTRARFRHGWMTRSARPWPLDPLRALCRTVRVRHDLHHPNQGISQQDPAAVH